MRRMCVLGWILASVMMCVATALSLALDQSVRASEEIAVIESAIGTRYVYAFALDGDLWYAALDDDAVMIDADGMELLKYTR